MNIGINDDEKNKRIEELIKAELKIIGEIKEKLKKEINKIDFILTKSKIDDMHNLVEEDIKEYFTKNEARFKLVTGTEAVVENWRKEQFFTNTLKIIFKELEIIVKRKNEYISKECILFKGNEGILISFLIENFRNINGIENDFEIYITRRKLEELIDIYEVEKSFIEKLEKNGLLIIDKYNIDNLFILLKNCDYTYEDESNFRKLIIQNYNLKINNKIKNEIKKYNNDKKELDKKLNEIKPFLETVDEDMKILKKEIKDSKIEGITILGIFTGILSCLSFEFNLLKDLLAKEEIIKNVSLIILVSCIGLITIIILVWLIKFLFLTPKDNQATDEKGKNKEVFLKLNLPHIIISGIIIILIIIVGLIYRNFKNEYREYSVNMIRETIIKDGEIKKLKKEIEDLKLKYEEYNKEKLIENTNKSNNIIILRR